MKKATLLLLVILLISSCKKDDESSNPSNVNLSNHNILLVIADDMGIDATPGYPIGAIKPNMPNLESLAADGLTFDNAWANPICAPTRATMLTGRYGYRTGVLDVLTTSNIPTTEKTIQTYLDETTNSAYSHAVAGKWHLSGNNASGPTGMGVGYYAGVLSGGVGDYYNWPLTENGQTNNTQSYCTSTITDLAIDWINEQDKPWFCWVAYTTPHTPFHFPPANTHSQGNLPTDTASINANPMPYYMAMIENLDFEMGRLLESIPADELANTSIIFIGDNGTAGQVVQAPYSSNRAKGNLAEGGVHVPLIVSGKDVSRKGQRDASLVSSVDLFATVAELVGLDLPVYEDSRSFKPLLTGTTAARSYNYAELLSTGSPNKTGYAIRDEQYKLIQFDSGTERFYDLSVDPYEQNNLSNNLSAAEATARQALLDEAGRIRQ